MELRQLYYFIAVAEELHFGRAATRLRMAQPPLSQQIQKLEEDLGVQLFVRTKRHVELTEVGKIFLEEARKTVSQAELAVQIAHRANHGEIGRLAIGFVGSASCEVLPKLVHNFRNQYPEVELQLRELTTAQQVRALRDGRIHVGLLRPPIHDQTLSLENIYSEPLLVALPQRHPLAEQSVVPIVDMAREPFILFPRQQGAGFYDQVISLCQQSNFSPYVVQEAVQMQTILGLVAARVGISLIPASASLLRQTGIEYRHISPSTVQLQIALAWNESAMIPALHTFLRTARTTFSET